MTVTCSFVCIWLFSLFLSHSTVKVSTFCVAVTGNFKDAKLFQITVVILLAFY